MCVTSALSEIDPGYHAKKKYTSKDCAIDRSHLFFEQIVLFLLN